MKKQRKSLILGLGISGKAAARFLLRRGEEVWGFESNREVIAQDQDLLKLGIKVVHEEDPLEITQFNQLILSPGFPPDHRLCLEARKEHIEIIGEVELACRHITQRMIGITGTNGKTTVTLLVAHALNNCGIPAKALGNVGVPLTDEVLRLNADDVVVAELSSFQLETLSTKVLDCAVVLNITPDHLDRYKTMENYVKAKLSISHNLKKNAPLYLFEAIPQEFPTLVRNIDFQSYGYQAQAPLWTDLHYLYASGDILCPLPKQLVDRRNHDLENFMAAYTLCSILGAPADQFLKAFATFKKPHHRIEFVRSVDNVDYYDDSKGTNIDAVIRAVQTLDGPIHLIAGGVDKGAPYTPWIEAFKGKVKNIYTIGQSAEVIEKQLSHSYYIKRCATLNEAVMEASKAAARGDKVLLSPGCSSFDMFKDYAHRGQEFQRLVNQIDVSGVTS